MYKLFEKQKPIVIQAGSRIKTLKGVLWLTWPQGPASSLRPGMSIIARKGTLAEAMTLEAEAEVNLSQSTLVEAALPIGVCLAG